MVFGDTISPGGKAKEKISSGICNVYKLTKFSFESSEGVVSVGCVGCVGSLPGDAAGEVGSVGGDAVGDDGADGDEVGESLRLLDG